MRLIDADAYKSRMGGVYEEYWEEVLDDMPTVDAVEVVRCRDCHWYNNRDGCLFSTAEIDEDDYCSYGERKD